MKKTEKRHLDVRCNARKISRIAREISHQSNLWQSDQKSESPATKPIDERYLEAIEEDIKTVESILWSILRNYQHSESESKFVLDTD